MQGPMAPEAYLRMEKAPNTECHRNGTQTSQGPSFVVKKMLLRLSRDFFLLLRKVHHFVCVCVNGDGPGHGERIAVFSVGRLQAAITTETTKAKITSSQTKESMTFVYK